MLQPDTRDARDSDSPTAADCRAALGRLIDSAEFQAAPRLTAFIRFVVDATLCGRAETVKAYTVAVDGLGRTADFDPSRDSIVRVEAGRLRAALARYYGGAGSDDPLVIAVPRGGYIPHFRWRSPSAGAEPSALHPAPLWEKGRAAQDAAAAIRSENLARRADLKATLTTMNTTLDSLRSLVKQVQGQVQTSIGNRYIVPVL